MWFLEKHNAVKRIIVLLAVPIKVVFFFSTVHAVNIVIFLQNTLVSLVT